MFYGSYVHNLDNKGRLVIPSKMRDELGSKAYILKGYDGALSIFKENDFLGLVQKIKSLPFTKKNARAHLRVQLASVCELDIDKQGRALLPTQLLAKYKIGSVKSVINTRTSSSVRIEKCKLQQKSILSLLCPFCGGGYQQYHKTAQGRATWWYWLI